MNAGRRFLKAFRGVVGLLLFVLAICVALAVVFRHFPLETLVIAAMFVVAGLAIVLYVWELVIIGWVVDFLSEVGMPKIQAVPIPLEYERIGEIIVVTLRDNIATVLQCQSVQKQLDGLIAEHHCDFILDFSSAGRISRTIPRRYGPPDEGGTPGGRQTRQSLSPHRVALGSRIPSVR